MPLFDNLPVFRKLKENPAEFADVVVDVGGYRIVWGDALDLSCDELWREGNEKAKCYQ